MKDISDMKVRTCPGANQRRLRLRAMLDQPGPLFVPGAVDALSAIQVQHAGFDAVHFGSYSLASARGLPDVGLLDMSELAAATRVLVEATDVPVIADAEDGFYEAASIWRTVHAYEDAGASAIHIDDHVSGKHTRVERRVLALDDMVWRISAALQARRDPAFLIIARTDLGWATGNADDTERRLQAFCEAGADVVMVTGLSLAQLGAMRGKIAAKVVIVATPGLTRSDYQTAGIDMVIYHDLCLSASFAAVESSLAACRAAIGDNLAPASSGSMLKMEQLLDYKGHDRRSMIVQAR